MIKFKAFTWLIALLLIMNSLNSAGQQLEPNPEQSAFMELGYGMFIHFGINTFNDKEWSYGDLPLESFNTDSIDTDQWCRLAKSAGINYIIFTTKHVDGFCNWDTEYTNYKVTNTPYGKDLLSELATSCEKYGLKLGLYYCLWDENQPLYKKNEHVYNRYVRSQVNELLTEYGNIACFWFDGFWKRQQSGWSKKKDISGADKAERLNARDKQFVNAWRLEGAFRWEWDQLYLMIKEIHPGCIIFNNPTSAYKGIPLFPVDARPAEKGQNLQNDKKIWNWLGDDIYLPLQIETTLSQKGDELFLSGNWFWHEWDTSVATLEMLEQWADNAKKLDANLVINVGPMANGNLRPVDINLLKQIYFKR